jgi:hypothetical protein
VMSVGGPEGGRDEHPPLGTRKGLGGLREREEKERS